MSEELDQPAWVCLECGNRYGLGAGTHTSTMHLGTCGVCGEERTVTQARDFGYLSGSWQNHLEKE